MLSLAIKSEIKPTIQSQCFFIKDVKCWGKAGSILDIDIIMPRWSLGLMNWYYQRKIEALINRYGNRNTEYHIRIR